MKRDPNRRPPPSQMTEDERVEAARPRRQGRRKGVPNRYTGDIKAMIREALIQEGGVEYLRWLATVEPRAFATLVAKTVPAELESDGAPVRVLVVSGVPKGADMVSETRGSFLGDPTARGAAGSS